MKNKKGFSRCANDYIGRLREEGRYFTAHVYQSAIFSFSKFCGTCNVSFRQITRECLRLYEEHLCERGLKPNTVSTYMRMIRSIYNRGVKAGNTPYVFALFHEAYTGIDVRQKKALPLFELYRLLYEDPQSERLRRTQDIWLIWKSRLLKIMYCVTNVSRPKLLCVWKYLIVRWRR